MQCKLFGTHLPFELILCLFDSIFFSAARILRAIRIAARLGFSISKETAHFVKNLSSSVLKLDKVFKVYLLLCFIIFITL